MTEDIAEIMRLIEYDMTNGRRGDVDDHFLGRRKEVAVLITAYRAQAARIAALEKALEPSLETKVEYIGEVRETLTLRDEDGEEYSHQHTISWDATKDIMKMIRAYADGLSARALLNPTPTEER